MDIADVDLNLLVVFDALLRTRSVSGAARTLGMSQPATSFALNRLRKMFGEPLFVRTARGIHPTPYAESLGVNDERDVALRALFREDKFRQALSHAIDRDGIAGCACAAQSSATIKQQRWRVDSEEARSRRSHSSVGG